MKIYQIGMTQLAIMIAVVGCFAGCGGQSSGQSEKPADLQISNQSISGSFSRDRLTEAARRENRTPLQIKFQATEKRSREVGWYEMTIGGLYDGRQFKGIRVSMNGRFVDFRPRSLVSLIQKSVIFDVFDDQGTNRAPLKVELKPPDQSTSSRLDWDSIGRWLIVAGAVVLAVALPVLLLAGVFGVALVIVNAVAQAIGALIWAVFLAGLLAVATGLLILVIRVIWPDLTVGEIKSKMANLWQKIVGIARGLVATANQSPVRLSA